MKKVMVLLMALLVMVPNVMGGVDLCETFPELCDFDVCELFPDFCHQGPLCGDGVPEHPEECDDGNQVDGDGCSANCTQEQPPENVPEFTTMGALAALGGAGYFMYRRKK